MVHGIPLLILGIAVGCVQIQALADVNPMMLADGAAGRVHIGMTSLELARLLDDEIQLEFAGDNRSVASVRDQSKLNKLGLSTIEGAQVLGVDISLSNRAGRDIVDMIHFGLSCQSARRLSIEWKLQGALVVQRQDGWSSGDLNHKYTWGIRNVRGKCSVWFREHDKRSESQDTRRR